MFVYQAHSPGPNQIADSEAEACKHHEGWWRYLTRSSAAHEFGRNMNVATSLTQVLADEEQADLIATGCTGNRVQLSSMPGVPRLLQPHRAPIGSQGTADQQADQQADQRVGLESFSSWGDQLQGETRASTRRASALARALRAYPQREKLANYL